MRHDAAVRVVGYIRVSTEEQGTTGASLAAQESMLREEARRRGWDLLGIYSDVASGKSTAKRHGLADALAALEGGGPWAEQPQAVMVVRLDRLTRSVADGGRLFERAQKKGWGIVALDLGVDTTTPAGELVANVMVAVGQWERRVIGERTRDGLAERRRQGKRLGRRATVELEGEEGDRARATLRRILRMREAEVSYRKIADQLNDDGVPGFEGGRWHERQVRRAVAAEQARREAQQTLSV